MDSKQQFNDTLGEAFEELNIDEMTKIQGTGFESLSISWPIVTYFEISLSLAHQVNVYSHLRKKRNK